MEDFRSGLFEVISGIVGAIVISVLMQSFKESGLVPSSVVYLFAVIGFAGSLAMLFSFWKAGVIFILGWILGAWLLRDVLSTFDFIIYFVAPIVALITRAVIFIKSEF